MDFKIEFIQICFRCSADFIQPSFLLFCDVVIDCSLSINRALLFPFFDLFCEVICLYDLHYGFTCLYDLHCGFICFRGGSRIFFRKGCTRLLLYFNTNKPHSFFFCRITVVLENRRSSQGGCAPPAPFP